MGITINDPATQALLAQAEIVSRARRSGYVSPAHVLLAALEGDDREAARELTQSPTVVPRLRLALEGVIARQPPNPELLTKPQLPMTSWLTGALRVAQEQSPGPTPRAVIAAIVARPRGELTIALRARDDGPSASGV